MNFKKRVNGSWTDTSHYIHKTDTDTITTLPADLYADGNNATVGLKGNMYQASGVSPDNPIQPSETGERTENLFDKDNADIYNAYFAIDAESSVWITNADSRSVKIACEPNTQYTLSILSEISIFRICSSSNINITPSGVGVRVRTIVRSENRPVYTFTTSADDACIIFQGSASLANMWLSNLMLVKGSTAPTSFIPYGYKIPISSASTTTPVYLGEVETMRKIKKQILTGTETVSYNENEPSNRIMVVTLPTNETGTNTPSNVICTHFETKNTVAQTSSGGITMRSNGIDFVIGIGYDIINVDSDSSPVEVQNAFKAYLAAQYANGTPVTVWYVLATPTTGIVNEPLRKIGDYADTVSGITIPTITGADSFDVLTTLKPSEVELTYTGWHDATVKEWDGSDWQ